MALVDGNNHQIQRIHAESQTRNAPVTIVIDIIHVLEYLWKATWCFHAEGDPAAEDWVRRHATAVLAGRATRVAGAIRGHHRPPPAVRVGAVPGLQDLPPPDEAHGGQVTGPCPYGSRTAGCRFSTFEATPMSWKCQGMGPGASKWDVTQMATILSKRATGQ